MEKILITGANGYIGSAISALLEHGNKYQIVHLIDRLENIEPKSLDFDFVIHSAGVLRNKPIPLLNANSDGTYQLIQGLNKPTPILYLSSKSVYNKTLSGCISEETLAEPYDEYGNTKLKGEQHIINSVHPFIILRVSTVFGRFTNRFSSCFPDVAFQKLCNSEDLTLSKDDIITDYLFLPDLVNVVGEIISDIRFKNQVFNIAGLPLSLHSLITGLHKTLKSDSEIVYKKIPITKNFVLDSDKLVSHLGRKFHSGLETILQSYKI